MSDDIVTRLRAYNIGNIAHEASSHMEEMLYEAADEIERLRAEVDEAEKWTKVYAEMYTHLESKISQITEIVKYFDKKYEATHDEQPSTN